jgi:UDP-N-acetylglucosamine 2-epimerase (non-hydrolysing)
VTAGELTTPGPAAATVAAGQVLVVAGTRPEAVKLAGVTRALGARAVLAHTGQHYDDAMWDSVRREVGLPEPRVRIEVGGSHRGVQIGTATAALTQYLLAHPLAAVLVQGDTNSTLAGALAANATGTLLVHVEAGLRSDDPTMPEESNRVLVDRVADLCCAPAEQNAARLRTEGVPEDRIAVTGNTLFDALHELLPGPQRRRATLDRYDVRPDRFVLATVHRMANVDHPGRLTGLLEGLAVLSRQAPVLFPVHPRTLAAARAAGLQPLLDRLRLLDPLSPGEFLTLEAEAGLVASDSGGVQEEACFLRRPLVVLRDSTERPELLDGWCELLGDREPCEVLLAAWRRAPQWRGDLASRALPYAEGGASARIVAELDARLVAVAMA